RAPYRLVADLYALADVLVLPSESEGFGLPLLEAALHRLPIVCTALATPRALAGDAATYVSPAASGEARADPVERAPQPPGARLRAARGARPSSRPRRAGRGSRPRPAGAFARDGRARRVGRHPRSLRERASGSPSRRLATSGMGSPRHHDRGDPSRPAVRCR